MNGPGDIPLTHSSTPDTRPCSLVSIIPTLGMSSCRGRAEAFARRLSSKLRVLGTQADNDNATSQEDEPIINGTLANTWLPVHESEQTVTDLQPLRHESDSFFDFDCELESPGSPVDECEYLRLIETASNTPHNSAAESGYVCASAASSHSSTDGPFFDAAHNAEEATAGAQQASRNKLPPSEIPDYASALKLNGASDRLSNGHSDTNTDEPHEESHVEPHKSTSAASNLHYGHDQTDHQACELTQSLPITGPDVATTSTEPPHAELSASELVQAQDRIISELQQQSEQVTVMAEAKAAEQQVPEDASPEAGAHSPEIVHTLVNGHTEDGEDLLRIEMTEFEPCTTVEEIRSNLKELSVLIPDQLISEEAISNSSLITTTTASTSEKQQQKVEQPVKAASASALDTTDDEDDCRPQRVRRCSSLKTGKTPPGTPGRKKIVRFADVLGLDLADIKTFLDEIPTIPKSAFEDLEIMDSEPPIQLGPKSDKFLMPLFQQPGGMPTFLDLVREKQVSLENAAVTDTINMTITGSVRCRNLDFHKSVHIRYSLDGWRSFADLQANYVDNSCDGFSDKFTFIIFCNSMHVGQRIEFAVRFQCKGQQFWDNNYGANYCFQCLPTSTNVTHPITTVIPPQHHHAPHLVSMLSPTVGEAWCSSFY